MRLLVAPLLAILSVSTAKAEAYPEATDLDEQTLIYLHYWSASRTENRAVEILISDDQRLALTIHSLTEVMPYEKLPPKTLVKNLLESQMDEVRAYLGAMDWTIPITDHQFEFVLGGTVTRIRSHRGEALVRCTDQGTQERGLCPYAELRNYILLLAGLNPNGSSIQAEQGVAPNP